MSFPTAIATFFIFRGFASQAAHESIFPLRGVFLFVVQNDMVESFHGGAFTFQQDRGLWRREYDGGLFTVLSLLNCVLWRFRFNATLQSVTKCDADFSTHQSMLLQVHIPWVSPVDADCSGMPQPTWCNMSESKTVYFFDLVYLPLDFRKASIWITRS